MPLTHGNAWSVYFSDPSSTASRCSSTRRGTCAAASEAARPVKSNDEIVAVTQTAFVDEPEFGDLGEFYDRRAAHLAERSHP